MEEAETDRWRICQEQKNCHMNTHTLPSTFLPPSLFSFFFSSLLSIIPLLRYRRAASKKAADVTHYF